MEDTGASITITTLTNVLAFVIGALTPTPEIQLFSIGNALAIIIDYIYQWTVFGAVMVIMGKYELTHDHSDEHPEKPKKSKIRKMAKKMFRKVLDFYCKLLTNAVAVSAVMALLAGYMYMSIYGVLEMKAELRPEQLFIADSDVIQVSHHYSFLHTLFRYWSYVTSTLLLFTLYVLCLSTTPATSLNPPTFKDSLRWWLTLNPSLLL